ncbi:hypothetical protein PVNG_04471 [Plasmodium vivax North Korean]|uniref:Uncharacterized protein n=1 Tax=Plasmodium vivax North Korean TaxID=1035514 RepID=A0A0J9U2I3_PLAVI|nr:hypothetical protein PVNG_04471 [Plasmodium vivax North Korean]
MYIYINKLLANKVIFDSYANSSREWYDFICKKEQFSHLGNSKYYESICLSFVSGLKYIQTQDLLNVPDEPSYDFTSDYCEYINYWLNYKLSEIENSECYASQFYNIIKSNINIYFPNLKKYEGLIRNIKKDDIKNIDVLFNLYDNMGKYISSNVGEDSDSNPCMYAEKCVTLYDDNISQCYSDISTSFCKEMLNFRKIYHTNVENEIKCHGLKKFLLHPQSVEECETSSVNKCEIISDILLSQEQIEQSYPVSSENIAGYRVDDTGPEEDIVVPRGDSTARLGNPEESEELPGIPSVHEGQTYDMKSRDSQGAFDDLTGQAIEDSDVSHSPDTPKTTAIALPALSALSLGFMLYKVYMNKILILLYYS